MRIPPAINLITKLLIGNYACEYVDPCYNIQLSSFYLMFERNISILFIAIFHNNFQCVQIFLQLIFASIFYSFVCQCEQNCLKSITCLRVLFITMRLNLSEQMRLCGSIPYVESHRMPEYTTHETSHTRMLFKKLLGKQCSNMECRIFVIIGVCARVS